VREDYAKAYKLFDQACQKGDALGCYNMGNMYENGIGREQNQNDAIHFYGLACSSGLQIGCQSLKLLQERL
jgi:TPR repeat protein